MKFYLKSATVVKYFVGLNKQTKHSLMAESKNFLLCRGTVILLNTENITGGIKIRGETTVLTVPCGTLTTYLTPQNKNEANVVVHDQICFNLRFGTTWATLPCFTSNSMMLSSMHNVNYQEVRMTNLLWWINENIPDLHNS